MPFFSPTAKLSRPEVPRNARCGACGLYKGCISPKMPVGGRGRKGILLVGEAPGRDEDEKNTQFVGKTGQRLRRELESVGIDIDDDCWRTNALICRPPKNRNPTSEEVSHCRPNLFRTIEVHKPTVIVPLGAFAVKAVVEPFWRSDVGAISQWAGWKIPLQKWNAWVVPTYHPSYVERTEEDSNGKVVALWFRKHLEAASELQLSLPWSVPPRYEDGVEIINDQTRAARYIHEWLDEREGKWKELVVFDYETNRLKPDAENAEIVCCSVCFGGRRTISFPWGGDVVGAMSRLLKSPHPKGGANNKFEERWTRKFLGHGVRNWVWDTMTDSHILDNRRGITSVKFQAFVRLGFEDWSYSVKPLLESTDERGVNRIREIDQRTLLMYCGLDSLVEYELIKRQRKEMESICRGFSDRPV